MYNQKQLRKLQLHRFYMAEVRLRRGEYFADIIRDKQYPDIWMYVVQRQGSSEILALGSCHSKEEARTAAGEAIGSLLARKLAAAN